MKLRKQEARLQRRVDDWNNMRPDYKPRMKIVSGMVYHKPGSNKK